MSQQQGKKAPVKLIMAFVLLAIAAASFGVYMQRQNDKTNIQAALSATYLQSPRRINDFSLIADNGKPYTKLNLKKHWTWLFFGFTSCHHICPTTMTELKQAYLDLAHHLPKAQLPKVIMVSVDPERDTVKRIGTYVKAFDKAFIGLTGDAKQIKKLADSVSVVYLKINKGKMTKHQQDYKIDHSGAVILLDPEANVRAFFSMPHNSELMAQDYQTIITKL